VVPSGVTLDVGGDAADGFCWRGTLTGAVSGPGALNVAGMTCYGPVSYSTITTDLSTADVTLGPGAIVGIKPGGSATNVPLEPRSP
jgi:hypothetical protein